MTEQFLIQCPKCDTHYNDLQDVCPYCGAPQPTPDTHGPVEIAVESTTPEEIFEDETFAEDVTTNPDLEPSHHFPQDNLDEGTSYPPPEAFIPVSEPYLEDDMFAADEDLLEEAYLEDYADQYEEAYYEDRHIPDQIEAYHHDLASPYPTDHFVHPDELEEDFLSEETDEDIEEIEEIEETIQPAARRFTWLRFSLGCLGVLVCATLFYGGIGLVAVQQGLQERALLAQSESQAHFQKGQVLLDENNIELAIAEFERALNLNPNLPQVRQALRDAQKIIQAQPTPTSQTRSAAAVDIFKQAETEFAQDNWADAIQTLSKVQDLDPNYQPEEVSDMLYTANFQLGLEALAPDQMDQTLAAFDQALEQRPNDPDVEIEQAKALLYVEALTLLENDVAGAIEMLEQLYRENDDYLDTAQLLVEAYETYGDELLAADDSCLANVQYTEANDIQPQRQLEGKIENSETQCNVSSTPSPTKQPTRAVVATSRPSTTESVEAGTPAPITTPTVENGTAADISTTAEVNPEDSAASAPTSGGSILYSAYSTKDLRWEILAAPINGSTPKVVAINATMPSLSPNGQLLLYHSEAGDSEGLHVLNLATGEDIRVTTVRAHLYPRWSNNLDIIFTSQEEATGRWLYYQAFGDGKSDAIIMGDGRTADWSRNGQTIAYQGTDPQGNQPGIYRIPFGGGEATRLTNHASDRSPAFSPNGSQIAYMSAQNGNWDVYTVPVTGGTPRQITNASGNDGLPTWSPDGSQIAFVSDSGGSWGIYITNLNGSRLTRVSDWDGNRPDWLVSQIWWQP